jgi:hypothetical protein
MIIETYSIAVGTKRLNNPWQSNSYRIIMEWLAGYAYEWEVNAIPTGKLGNKVNKIFDYFWDKEERLEKFGLIPEDITVVLCNYKGYIKFDPNYIKLNEEDIWQYISCKRLRDLEVIAIIKGH